MDPLLLVIFSFGVTLIMFGFMVHITNRLTKMFDESVSLMRDVMNIQRVSDKPVSRGRSPIHNAIDPDNDDKLQKKFVNDGLYKK